MEEVGDLHPGVTVSSGAKENSLWVKLFEAKQQRRLELARLPFERKLEIIKLLQKMARASGRTRKRR